MKELYLLLGKLEDKMDKCNFPSIKIYSDGSGGISDSFGKDLFCFDDIKEAIDWLRKETKKEEYFDFGTKFTIDFNGEKNPLYIAYREAIDGEDALRTLIVNPDYELEVIKNFSRGRTGLKLKRK